MVVKVIYLKILREDNGYTYGAYSSIGANRYGASRFNATAKVRNMVTDSAVVEALKKSIVLEQNL